MRIHIGHHFYGAGNFGDDLMLAGLLAAAAEHCPGSLPQFTCCIPFDPAPQRLRFPQVKWLPYAPEARDQCVRDCDAWLGPGGSPFQADQGAWFIDHLAGEMDLCRRHDKPMYFLGVGVNDRRDLDHAVTRAVLAHAAHLWTRSADSAQWIREVCGHERVTAGADLSHVFLRDEERRAIEAGTLGLVLNFEDAAQFDPAALEPTVLDPRWREARWLHQEVRELPGSEAALWRTLPEAWRDRLRQRVPDYAAASLRGLLDSWGVPEVLGTSRYHAAIVGAWSGSRVVCVERNDKVRALCRELSMSCLQSLKDPRQLAEAVRSAGGVPRPLLEEQSSLAGQCAGEFFARVAHGA